jgi:DNA invertase Pin-like site-specific DNA recombinase
VDDLRRLVQHLTKRGICIEFVKECLTFTGEQSPMANLLLIGDGAFAELERALIWERGREGIALAKQRDAYRGHKKPWWMTRWSSFTASRVPVSQKPRLLESSVSVGRTCTNTLNLYLSSQRLSARFFPFSLFTPTTPTSGSIKKLGISSTLSVLHGDFRARTLPLGSL